MTQQRVDKDGHVHPEHAFTEASYLFLTFLYGAGVHLVISTGIESHLSNFTMFTVGLALVAFLFSDWTSRTRLPRLLPEPPSGPIYVIKSLLEIVCAFFLICCFLIIISREPDAGIAETSGTTPLLAFGFFLIATALWDWLMTYVMRSLDFIPLARSVFFTGNALGMTDTREKYLGRFDKWKANRVETIEARLFSAGARPEDESLGAKARAAVAAGTKAFSLWTHLLVFEAALAALTQFLANHVLFANAFAGAMVVIEEVSTTSPRAAFLEFLGLGGLSHLWQSLSPTLAVLVIAIALMLLCCIALPFRYATLGSVGFLIGGISLGSYLAPSSWLSLGAIVAGIILLSTACYMGLKSDEPRTRTRFAGWLIVGPLVLLYLVLPPLQLCAMLAIQQVLANCFLQFGVSKPSASPASGSGPNPHHDCVPA